MDVWNGNVASEIEDREPVKRLIRNGVVIVTMTDESRL